MFFECRFLMTYEWRFSLSCRNRFSLPSPWPRSVSFSRYSLSSDPPSPFPGDSRRRGSITAIAPPIPTPPPFPTSTAAALKCSSPVLFRRRRFWRSGEWGRPWWRNWFRRLRRTRSVTWIIRVSVASPWQIRWCERLRMMIMLGRPFITRYTILLLLNSNSRASFYCSVVCYLMLNRPPKSWMSDC